MTLTVLNIIYVLLAIAMIGFILVQRGAGAQAGSGFGAGASATVFGARGAGNFLTRATGVLAALFLLLSLGMAWWITHGAKRDTSGELGVMAGATVTTEAAPAAPVGDVPAAPVVTPVAGPAAAANDVPAATPAIEAAPAPEVESQDPPKQ
jgi:preprotein translocase subunit SecG